MLITVRSRYTTIRRVYKSLTFSVLAKARKLLKGTFVENLPGVKALYGSLFWHLWSRESVMEIQGSKMYLNPDNLPKRFKNTLGFYITSGVWEELTTEMFKKVVKEGDIVADLGANIGYFTLLASSLAGKEGRVYAFEPEPINYSILVKNIEINEYKNITPVQKAVSNTTGTVRLFIDTRDSGSHTIGQYNDKGEFVDSESVTLDEYFKDKGHTIDVVKMDIEGAEMAALLGMDRIIRENENLKIFTEFNPYLIEGMGYTAEEFAHKLLEDWHFSVTVIEDFTKNKRCMRINSVGELMDLCKSCKYVNLLLEKA